jgi:DNA-binding LytR/AlgR family response regulator
MNTTINCIIIDDEALAISVIKNHLSHFKDLNIIGEFNDPVSALQIIQNKKPDVIFLDINMSIMNGLDFLKSLHEKPIIVITTAYREYAVESFDLEVLDYLVKPISLKRFMHTIERIHKLVSPTKSRIINKNNYLFIKVNKKMIKLNYNDIIYIESLRDYIKFVTENEQYMVLNSMSNIIKELPNNQFLRIHRSFSININKIISIDGNLIELPHKKIPIGRNYLSEIKNKLLNL